MNYCLKILYIDAFGRTKLHKKDLEKYIFFYLRKLSRFKGKFSGTASVRKILKIKSVYYLHSTRN